jgi:hypothetical protein
MAKRKSHKRRHHRRGRVGASMLNPNGMIVKLGSVAAGFFLGDTINTAIDSLNMLPATPATATAAASPASARVPSALLELGELGLGALLLLKVKKPGAMGLVLRVGGGVLAGAGLRRVAKSMGIVSGYQSVPVVGRRMGAYQSVPVIGRVPAQLSGTPSQLRGFRVNGTSRSGYMPVGTGVMGSVGPIAGDASYQSAYNNGSGYMR